MIHKVLIYWNTIKYLKNIQIIFRVYYKFKLNYFISRKLIKINKKIKYINLFSNNNTFFSDNFFYINNESAEFSKIGWYPNSKDDLWNYKLHYFDYINNSKKKLKKDIAQNLIYNWIENYQFKSGIGWDPYPTSIRIINWITWSWNNKFEEKKVIENLLFQIRYLSKNLEWHILGNHLLTNAKSLIFAGLFFEGNEARKWLKTGIKILEDQLDEQVLKDGGHFELSPMYHSLFLKDLIEIYHLAKKNNSYFSKNFIQKILSIINKMFKWLELMCHPDGEISYFNDSVINEVLKLDELKELANYYNIQALNNIETNKLKNLHHLKDSGYINISAKNFLAIIDVGRVGPSYLPGHAHADTLSFELSLYNNRFFVNSGISCYGVNNQRHIERSTQSHNTVKINDSNSSNVWSSFRVAERAFPQDLSIIKKNQDIIISCSHNGYKRKHNIIHKRIWHLSKNKFSIEDEIIGNFKNAFANFILHPEVKNIKLNHNSFEFIFCNKKVSFMSNNKASLIKKKYNLGFGKSILTNCILIEFNENKNLTNILWS